MECGFYHPDRGYWQAIGVSTEPYTIIVEPERVEVDEEGNETIIPAVTRETTQLAELMATYPEGTVQVPLKPGADYEWQDGEWVYAPSPVDLGSLKASLKAQIDADAEAERLKYITPGAGQAMTYQQKAAEATAYLADTDPDPADYPLLAAEVGITGDTIADIAAVVDGQYQAWLVIGAAIEQARLGGKAAVDAAETTEDAQAAYAAIVWPSV